MHRAEGARHEYTAPTTRQHPDIGYRVEMISVRTKVA
jgi:hypothetical protein